MAIIVLSEYSVEFMNTRFFLCVYVPSVLPLGITGSKLICHLGFR